ncbi:MAG: aa3-type cytochrome c oxidase subunit IV [Alphaproteobacteria bacterium]|jgi:hypothetical protein|nr:aa3-type cytochrome c oxidase subunit IV [Alphaproteobacteria bacterium]
MPYNAQQSLEEHQATYKAFMRLTIYSTVAVAITLALMALFLT